MSPRIRTLAKVDYECVKWPSCWSREHKRQVKSSCPSSAVKHRKLCCCRVLLSSLPLLFLQRSPDYDVWGVNRTKRQARCRSSLPYLSCMCVDLKHFALLPSHKIFSSSISQRWRVPFGFHAVLCHQSIGSSLPILLVIFHPDRDGQLLGPSKAWIDKLQNSRRLNRL